MTPSRALLAAALVALIVAVAPGGARAAVSRRSSALGPTQIVVTAPGGARAIIHRNPFGLTIVNAAGQLVLRELAGSSNSALPTPVTSPAQLEFGTISPPPAARYAPLSFLVGTQSVAQTPAGEWEGDLSSVGESGIEYSAQSVRSARPLGSGVALTLATNDPTGRTLQVTITPGSEGELNLSAHPDPAAGVATMSDSFQSSNAEEFHGFGGRHNGLDQHGNEFYNWLAQENVSSGSANGITSTTSPGQDRYMFPNGPEAAYYVQSSFVSSDGYGFRLGQDEISHWRLDSDRPDAWQVEDGAPALEYSVVAAAPVKAVSELTATTGRQPVPPTWAVGSLLDREVKYPSDPASHYQAEVLSDLANIARYHLRVDAYRIEGWAELPRSELARDMAQLRARRIHPLLYFRPFVGTDKTGTDDPSDYSYAISHHYVATRADGSPYTFVSNFNAPAALIDFTDPAAVSWWKSRISTALNLGADGFMQDFGEQVLTGMHFHNGMTGVQMHNLYPVLYDRATRQVVAAFEKAHHSRQIFFFTRAGYTGSPGDAASENANFPGDETTDWTRSSGLASQTTDMLNRAIGGAYGFSTDIGGYFDLGPYQPTSEELFLRWAEWAALSPLFRLHGSLTAGTHVPWNYSRQAVQRYEEMVALHMAARPLILKLWHKADRTGMPITRPLWLAYPHDRGAARQDQEWLLGADVLVAPVVAQGATSRQVYFPSGCWEQPDTGAQYNGPTSRDIAAPLASLPYFFACGTQPFVVPGPPRCPTATGRLTSRGIGRLRLGETRRAVRRTFKRVRTRHLHYMDFFCLAGNGVRVGYPSPRLKQSLRGRKRRQLSGRSVLLLTANPHYALAGIRPGAQVRGARTQLRHAMHYRIGKNTWYLMPDHRVSGVFKVTRGRVREVGIANPALTHGRRSARRFLSSFRQA